MKPISSLSSIVFCIVLFAPAAFAQNKIGKISGAISTDDGKPVDGVTISLIKAKDSALVKVAITNKAGEYEMERLPIGKFIVKATAVNYSPSFSKAVEITEGESTIAVPSIQLKAADKDLGNVKVTSSRPLIENRIDKTIVNVEAAVTNVGSTALDVLEKSPGITIDKDGNISLKGKQGVIVLMDGKPTYLGAADLANLLRNTPAGQLDQIEIMSQPSAKFDASGNSGVINIKTKRSTASGFNGSVSASYTQGVYPKANTSFAINSRKGKRNVFANYSTSYFKGFNEIQINRKFRNQSTKELLGVMDQKTNSVFEGQPHSLKLGADFFATEKTTYGIVLNGFYNERKGSGNSLSTVYDGAGNITSYNSAISTNKDPWSNYSINLNFRHAYNKKGKEITADFDHVAYFTKSQQYSNNDSLDYLGRSVDNRFILNGNLPSDIKIYTARVDFAQPLKGDARFEAGLKVSYVKTDNDAQFTHWDKRAASWVNDSRSNHFLYDENINAAYVNYNKQMKKVGVQLGLRLENTIAKGNQLTNHSDFDRNYTQLFPTAYFSYKLDPKNNLGLSYGRRIERPNYQDMNPFQYLLDRYTYRQGNPMLTPQFSHNIEFSHNYKGQLNTSINFTQTKDVINDILKQNDETKITFQTKENIATRRNIGVSISYNKPITKYWTISAFANIFNNYFEGLVNNRYLSADLSSVTFNMSNQFKFSKTLSGEISGFVRSKTLESGLILAEPMGMFSFGLSQQVMKGKGSFRLNVRDPFWLQKFHGSTRFDNIDADIRSKWDNRQVAVSFTYRFGKNTNNVPAPRRKASASQDEQNRVGQGTN
jgi:hypothetical protein